VKVGAPIFAAQAAVKRRSCDDANEVGGVREEALPQQTKRSEKKKLSYFSLFNR
jgi:hypothetical protein